jgi:hypothetical protein
MISLQKWFHLFQASILNSLQLDKKGKAVPVTGPAGS